MLQITRVNITIKKLVRAYTTRVSCKTGVVLPLELMYRLQHFVRFNIK